MASPAPGPAGVGGVVDALSRPRFVVVTRKTPLEVLRERHGTVGQARFFAGSRGGAIDEAERIHERVTQALHEVDAAIPADLRRARVDRDELDRFVFTPDDVIVVVGQDGLVPNVAKYLNGQLVIGVNPDPEHYDGVLCRHAPTRFAGAASMLAERGIERSADFAIEARAMAEIVRDDGLTLRALNELFVGHRTHQSARYVIASGEHFERQSSSGIIFSTGTGSTGWARSIAEQRGLREVLCRPTDPRLAWFVREPFPSVSTGTTLSSGVIAQRDEFRVTSEMGDGGVVFGDGIESDAMEFTSGQVATIRVSSRRLMLVIPAPAGSKMPVGRE